MSEAVNMVQGDSTRLVDVYHAISAARGGVDTACRALNDEEASRVLRASYDESMKEVDFPALFLAYLLSPVEMFAIPEEVRNSEEHMTEIACLHDRARTCLSRIPPPPGMEDSAFQTVAAIQLHEFVRGRGVLSHNPDLLGNPRAVDWWTTFRGRSADLEKQGAPRNVLSYVHDYVDSLWVHGATGERFFSLFELIWSNKRRRSMLPRTQIMSCKVNWYIGNVGTRLQSVVATADLLRKGMTADEAIRQAYATALT